MLQTTAEEFSAGRGIPARRAEELVQLLKARVPMVFTVLMRLLDTSYATAHGEAAKRALDGRMPTNLGLPSTPRSSPTTVMGAVMVPQAVPATPEAQFHEYFRFPEEAEKIISKTLECLCQFFTWVDLSAMVTPHLLSTIFNFAQLKDVCNGEIGAAAMSCFNEMLSRNCVPANFDEYGNETTTAPSGIFNSLEDTWRGTPHTHTHTVTGAAAHPIRRPLGSQEQATSFYADVRNSDGVACFSSLQRYLLKLFQLTVELLRRVTAVAGTANPLVDLADGYNDKFTEFLSLFVLGHFKRVESNPSFAINEFLQLLFRFTFLQPEPENFVNCLDVCEQFIDIIVTRHEETGDAASLARYRACLLMLGQELLKKIRFKFNGESLMKLDNVDSNDDMYGAFFFLKKKTSEDLWWVVQYGGPEHPISALSRI